MQEQGSLTASFKNTWQIMDSLMAGTHTITVPADLRLLMFFNPAIENAVQAFRNNWFSTYRDKRTYELKIDR